MSGDLSAEDPRVTPPVAVERDIRPVVRKPNAGPSGLVLTGFALAAGLLVFGVLNAHRRSATAPAVTVPHVDATPSSAPPPLYLPAPPPPAPTEAPLQLAPAPLPSPPPPRVIVQPAPPQPVYIPQQRVIEPAPVPQRNLGGALMIVDSAPPAVAGSGADAAAPNATSAAPGAVFASSSPNRASAGMFANRATTVLQGTLIPAVLETAFDSTRPGFARALVQHDIRGFDGSKVLIPRGSRLIGEYGADTRPGQKRAMVAWFRLVRPDGVTIAIGSPAADPLGRGGVRAKVNSHFFERFAGAILQSTLDLGVNLASRSANSAVILALPNSYQGTAGSALRTPEIAPTLKVPAATSISVFVARDLDFTEVEGQR